MERLRELYYDPKRGYRSAVKLHDAVKDEMTLKEVRKFVANQEGAQLTKSVRENEKAFIPITGSLGNWQIDLMFYTDDGVVNRGYGVFLVAIEVNTRYCFVAALKRKDTYSVVKALSTMYVQVPDAVTVTDLTSDNGTEFKNAFLKKLLNTLEINQHFAEPNDHHKLGMVDRMILTLRTLIERYCVANNTRKFIDVLPKLVQNYNDTPHTSLAGMSPNKALKNLDRIADIRSALKVGAIPGMQKVHGYGDSQVRISRFKNTFEKGSGRTFSKEVHDVEETDGNRVKVNGNAEHTRAKLYSIERLQKVGEVDTAPQRKNAVLAEVQRQRKEHRRTQRRVRIVGIDQQNVVEPGTRRARVLPARYRD